MADKKFKTGAVRSADTNHLDYTSIPLVGLIGVARMLDQRFIKSVTSSVIDPDRLSEIEKLVLAESQNGEEQSQ